jgi:hypothetical protein
MLEKQCDCSENFVSDDASRLCITVSALRRYRAVE